MFKVQCSMSGLDTLNFEPGTLNRVMEVFHA